MSLATLILKLPKLLGLAPVGLHKSLAVYTHILETVIAGLVKNSRSLIQSVTFIDLYRGRGGSTKIMHQALKPSHSHTARLTVLCTFTQVLCSNFFFLLL